MRTTSAVGVAPTKASPNHAGDEKWVDEVSESRNGISLNRRPVTEYATTANMLNTNTHNAHQFPWSRPMIADLTRKYATNGRALTAAEVRMKRCRVGLTSAPSTPPLRGLWTSEA